MIIIYYWYHGGEQIRISIINKLKLVILKLLLLHMIHRDHLYQEQGTYILGITHIHS